MTTSPAGPRSLAYYVTAHGYGHGARSCDIVGALLRARPGLVVHLVSDLPREFLAARLPSGDVRYRAGRFDAGMVQVDSVRVDVPATLRDASALLARAPELLARERAFLQDQRVGVVVADIPGIPLHAAADLGLPALAVGNFAWDWIYEEFVERYAGWRPVVEHFRSAYARCDLLLRLPFAESMSAFPSARDLPVVARPGRARRAELARRFGAREDRTWVLLSFATLEWDEQALRRVGALSDCEFFAVKPLGWERDRFHAVDRGEFSYSDVMASCDAVITKPGFGVLSECAVNDKPIVYVERTDFREYPVLVESLRRYFRSVHLPAERLYEGDLAGALDALRREPAPRERLGMGGDDEAAREILARLPAAHRGSS